VLDFFDSLTIALTILLRTKNGSQHTKKHTKKRKINYRISGFVLEVGHKISIDDNSTRKNYRFPVIRQNTSFSMYLGNNYLNSTSATSPIPFLVISFLLKVIN
jgi:hypothetical protein